MKKVPLVEKVTTLRLFSYKKGDPEVKLQVIIDDQDMVLIFNSEVFQQMSEIFLKRFGDQNNLL